jgi:hypothetical protein
LAKLRDQKEEEEEEKKEKREDFLNVMHFLFCLSLDSFKEAFSGLRVISR